MNLGEIFENNFDCYADVDTYHACMPNWYKNEDTMAMTKDKFIEVVNNILLMSSNGNTAEPLSEGN